MTRGLSIRQVEDLTGLNRGYLSRLERGQIRTTAEARLQRVATAIETPLDLLIFEEKP